MVDFTKPTPEFPEELKSLASNINFAYKSISNEETLPFNQMTINEYMPGQGISAHIGMLISTLSFRNRFINL